MTQVSKTVLEEAVKAVFLAAKFDLNAEGNQAQVLIDAIVAAVDTFQKNAQVDPNSGKFPPVGG